MNSNNQDNNEIAGPGGSNLTGGDVTDHQDASSAMDESVETQVKSEEMEEAQQAGEVEQQTQHSAPFAGNPEDGLEMNNSPSDNQKNEVDDAKKNSEDNPNESLDELTEAKNRLLQLAADFENYKRQSVRREQEVRERAARNIIEDLLPVLDNFERAAQAANTATDVNSLRIGVQFILQQLQETLKTHGVEPIEAAGQAFDPLHHEALEEIDSDEHESGLVVDDVQRGYIYKGQVLRPSHVRVAK